MRAVVAGMIAAFPVGGVFWDYAQYALGLSRLGFEVFYLEDTGMPCFDPDARDWDYFGNWDPSAEYLERTFSQLAPELKGRWHLRADDGRSFGLSDKDIEEVVAGADVFINVSGASGLRDEYLPCKHKIYLDTDPGWNHFVRWPRGDRSENIFEVRWRSHDHYFTYAECMGRPDCALPDMGIRWLPTRPPVVLGAWDAADAGRKWTTVMTWDNFSHIGGVIEYNGVVYGTKEREFARVEDLPGKVDTELEIAVGGSNPPVDRFRSHGWSVIDSLGVSRTPGDYRSYVAESRGEFSVAKHVYTATRSGWFSCRSTCYLAAGRPVVLQDTGFSDFIPTGKGLLAFSTPQEAAASIAEVESDWSGHSDAARGVAASHFDSDIVLSELLNRMELNA